MNYSPELKQILEYTERTNFQHLSVNDFVKYASRLNELRPEEAALVIEQFPEVASMIRTSLSEYKGVLDIVVASDDHSLDRVYDVIDKEIDTAASSRKEYFAFAEKVREDLAKCLDNPDLSPEQLKEIRDQEMEIFRKVDAKDTEIRAQEKDAVQIAKEKDTEKRAFNWKLIGAASGVLVLALGVGVAALGGDFSINGFTKQ